MSEQHKLYESFYDGLRIAGPVGEEATRDMGYDTPRSVYASIAGAEALKRAIKQLSTPHIPSEANETGDNHGWPTDQESQIGKAALKAIRSTTLPKN